jgi:hypothetical protein
MTWSWERASRIGARHPGRTGGTDGARHRDGAMPRGQTRVEAGLAPRQTGGAEADHRLGV